jgi:drug/metabolite transporter (DMT)-like permease
MQLEKPSVTVRSAFEKPSTARDHTTASWATPLAFSILAYGLSGGLWKGADLGVGQYCLLLVIAKTLMNCGSWAVWSRRRLRWNAFLGWSMGGQIINGLAWICYFRALESGSAAVVQTITAAYTVLAVVLALIFLREKLVTLQLWGIVLALAAGTVLGYSPGEGAGLSGGGHWQLYCILTLLGWGSSFVIFKHAYNQPGADDFLFFLTNWVGICVILIPFGLAQPHDWGAHGLVLASIVVFLYAFGDLTLFAAINRGPAAIVSPLSGLYPVPTLFYSALVLHEHIFPSQWLAIAAILLAIVLVVPEADNPILRLRSRKLSL